MDSSASRPTALPTDTMAEWRQTEYGHADAVTLTRGEVPSPGRAEVLVRVRALSLNSGDVRVMRGEPRLLRMAFGLRRPKQGVRGMDVAATVVRIGAGVTEFAPGDEVVGELPGGGLAEYALAPVARLVHRPAAVDPATAAALPVAGGTAWLALERGGAASGQRVLVIGASGGVGTFAVQLAVDRSATVWALCGERNRAMVEGLGAERTFDYCRVQPGNPELGEAAFDVVIDIAGTASLRAVQRLVHPGGSVVLVAGEGGRLLGPIPRLIGAMLRSIGSKRPLRPLAATFRPDVLAELLAWAADHRITPVIERTYPFAEAGAALAHVDAGHTSGKVLVVR